MSEDKSREAAYHVDLESPPKDTERTNVSEGTQLPTYNAEIPSSFVVMYRSLKTVKAESDSTFSFLKSSCSIILSTTGYTSVLRLVKAIPMIVMGALYKDDCDAERMIPIYLLIGGSIGFASNLYSIINRCRKTWRERDADQKKISPVSFIMNCFNFGLFIAGCVFIYRTKGDFQSDDKIIADYCDYNLYWYAFWNTTLTFIIGGPICLLKCYAFWINLGFTSC